MFDNLFGVRNIPDYIVHYNRSEPFRSITHVTPDQMQEVLPGLNEENTWGLARFSDPTYLPQRLESERRLRLKFINIGGKPVLNNPIYFFLGHHPIFENHESNIGYLLELKHLDPASISFTYGDSLLSMIDENRAIAGDKYLNPLCSEIFSLKTLPELFLHPSYPADPLHVEAQLWTHPDLDKIKKMIRK